MRGILRAHTDNANVESNDCHCFTIATAKTATLEASPPDQYEITIRNAVSSAGVLTIDGNGKNIVGGATRDLAAGKWVRMIYNGTEWSVIMDN